VFSHENSAARTREHPAPGRTRPAGFRTVSGRGHSCDGWL